MSRDRCRSQWPERVKTRTRGGSPRQDQLWQSMRIMRARFTTRDLAAVTESGLDRIIKYVCALERAGFVRVVKKRPLGQVGRCNTYALVRDTGPQSPLVWRKRKGVYDRNTGIGYALDGTVIFSADGQSKE